MQSSEYTRCQAGKKEQRKEGRKEGSRALMGRDEREEGHMIAYQYIILNNGILKSNSLLYPRSEGHISQYTP